MNGKGGNTIGRSHCDARTYHLHGGHRHQRLASLGHLSRLDVDAHNPAGHGCTDLTVDVRVGLLQFVLGGSYAAVRWAVVISRCPVIFWVLVAERRKGLHLPW